MLWEAEGIYQKLKVFIDSHHRSRTSDLSHFRYLVVHVELWKQCCLTFSFVRWTLENVILFCHDASGALKGVYLHSCAVNPMRSRPQPSRHSDQSYLIPLFQIRNHKRAPKYRIPSIYRRHEYSNTIWKRLKIGYKRRCYA
jgi:hypothetical protein